ncbi:MAG: hypothetical protein Q9225_001026 [Loekoesia sp. 1 TL-2023]
MPPVIAFVPGFWEGTEPFENVMALLSKKDLQTIICPLLSTGTTSPGNPKMEDDIAAIRSSIEAVVAEEKDVITVMHSGGGFLGSNAVGGLSKKVRSEQGLKGGVIGIVFVTGAIYPEGFEHGDLPFGEVKDGALLCADAQNILFNDLDPAVADEWVGKLKPQPASGWNGTVTYCAWKDLPSIYLVCEGDQAIPPTVQHQLAQGANSKIETCAAGHMPHVGIPERVAEVIEAAVAYFGPLT